MAICYPPADAANRPPSRRGHAGAAESRAMSSSDTAAQRTTPADITARGGGELRRLPRSAPARDHAGARPPPARLRHRGRADRGGVARRRSGSSPPPATSPTSAARSSSSGRTRSASRCSSTRWPTCARRRDRVDRPRPVLRARRARARATARTSRASPPALPAWVHGRVLDLDGDADRGRRARRVAERRRPALRRAGPEAPEDHLRGRFRTRDDGSLRLPRRSPGAVPDPRRRAGRPDARAPPAGTRGGPRTST